MKNRLMTCLAAAVVVAGLAYSAPIARPTTGTLHGVVTDPSGAVIPGASILVIGPNFAKSVSTDESGEYRLSGLAAGHYGVQIRFVGFSTWDRSGLVLSSGFGTEADAQLSIRPAKQEITVNAQLAD